MILTLIFIGLLRLAYVMRDQIYVFINQWKSDVTGIEYSADNKIVLYNDVNFNSEDTLTIKSGEEMIIYERAQDDRTLHGATRDYWYVYSLKFFGNVDYQLIIYNDKDKQIIPLSDTKNTEVPNVIYWLKTLPEYARNKIDSLERRAIAIKVVSREMESIGTGVSTIPAIVYRGTNYDTEYLSGIFKQHLERGHPVEICMISSMYEKTPTGVYVGQTENKAAQKKTWSFRSLKINRGTKLKLIVMEESIHTKFKDVEIEFSPENNIPDFDYWLSLFDQTLVKFTSDINNPNQRRYLIELV